MPIRTTIVTLLALALLLPAMAQETSQPLTLQQCVELALKQQTSVLQGENSVVGAKARETQSKSSYYPQVTIDNSTIVSDRGLGPRRDDTTLSVTQNFYDGGLREARVRGAKADVAGTNAALARTRQTVVFTVTRDYFALLRAQRLREVQEARATYLNGYRDLVQGRIEAGDAAEVDLLPVEAQLANARVDLLAAKNAVRTAAIQLQRAMGLTPTPDFAVQESVLPAALPVQSLETHTAGALTARPDLVQTKAATAGAKASVDAAKIQRAPRLFLNGTFDQPMQNGDPNSHLIAGGVTFDLFDGGANSAALREARANEANARLRVTQLERDIRAEVEEALLNLESAQERLAASDASLKAAQKNYNAQDGRYRQGLAIPLDLINAQLEVVTAQSNAVQARYDYYTAYAQLEYAIGTQGGLYATQQ